MVNSTPVGCNANRISDRSRLFTSARRSGTRWSCRRYSRFRATRRRRSNSCFLLPGSIHARHRHRLCAHDHRRLRIRNAWDESVARVLLQVGTCIEESSDRRLHAVFRTLEHPSIPPPADPEVRIHQRTWQTEPCTQATVRGRQFSQKFSFARYCHSQDLDLVTARRTFRTTSVLTPEFDTRATHGLTAGQTPFSVSMSRIIYRFIMRL
jgi:hypothetical protein